MVNNIEKSILCGEYALGVFLDISGAFYNVDLKSAQAGMEAFNFPPTIRKWYSHYLENRNVTVDIKGCTETRGITKGNPQGGCLLYTSDAADE